MKVTVIIIKLIDHTITNTSMQHKLEINHVVIDCQSQLSLCNRTTPAHKIVSQC